MFHENRRILHTPPLSSLNSVSKTRIKKSPLFTALSTRSPILFIGHDRSRHPRRRTSEYFTNTPRRAPRVCVFSRPSHDRRPENPKTIGTRTTTVPDDVHAMRSLLQRGVSLPHRRNCHPCRDVVGIPQPWPLKSTVFAIVTGTSRATPRSDPPASAPTDLGGDADDHHHHRMSRTRTTTTTTTGSGTCVSKSNAAAEGAPCRFAEYLLAATATATT